MYREVNMVASMIGKRLEAKYDIIDRQVYELFGGKVTVVRNKGVWSFA